MVARSESMFGCYDSYSYRLWSLANVWSTCQFPSITNGLTKEIEEINSNPEYFIKCPKCQKGYPGFQALKEHMESSHTDLSSVENTTGIISNSVSPTPSIMGSGGPYGCSQCATSFATKDQLEKHELLHSPNAQVSCKICNKTFANVYRLQRHMISHDESAVLRKFKCTQCEKAFKFKHHLKEHIRIHSGEKPFECGNCGKRFSHSGSYSSHMTSKKCLVMNLKLGRTRGSTGNALLNKTPSQTSRSNKRILGNPLNNNLTTSPNHNTYLPILPKYTEAAAAFLHSSLATNHAIHPFYIPPTSLLNNSGPTISPYSMPSLNHIFEQLQGASPHRPQFIEAPEDMSVSNSAVSLKHETRTSPKISEAVTTGFKSNSSSCGDLVVATDAENANDTRTSIKEESNPADINSNGSDLEAVKRILETVNASVTKQLLKANMQKYTNDPDTNDRNSPSLISQNDFTCTICKQHFISRRALDDHECDQMDIQSEGLAAKLVDAVSIKIEDTHSSNYSCDEYDLDSDRLLDKNDDYDMDCESVTTTDQVSEDGRKVRVRSLIADKQLKVLKDHYNMNPRPKREELVKIAEKIGFPVRVVQVWFQNTRARDRREGRLIQVPYNPLSSMPLRLPPAIVPSNSQSTGLRVGYPLVSSPQYNLEQPLDLSTKKSPLLSTHSSPCGSPHRPPSLNPHSDSGEEVVNLSHKSSRSPTPFNQSYQNHYQNSNCSSDLRRSPSPMDFNNGSKLAKILAQPTHPLSLSNVGLVPMDGFMRLPALTQLINNRISNLSPSSQKRCWSEDNESIDPQVSRNDNLNKRTKVSQMVLKGLNSPSLVNADGEIEGQFICDECDKAFTKQSSLARHKYEHSGQRPHICDECAKAFKHKHHLTEHKRLHSGEKPYQCIKCLKRFSHSGSYSQHMNHRFSYCKPYRE